MKTLITATILSLGLLATQAPASAASKSFWTTLNESAPRSPFDELATTAPKSFWTTLNESAPRSPFDELASTAPKSIFDTLRDNAP